MLHVCWCSHLRDLCLPFRGGNWCERWLAAAADDKGWLDVNGVARYIARAVDNVSDAAPEVQE